MNRVVLQKGIETRGGGRGEVQSGRAPLILGTTSSVCLAKMVWLVHSVQGFVPWCLYFSNLHWWPSLAHLPSWYIRNSGCHQSELLPAFLTRTWQSGKCVEPNLINILSIFWMCSLVTSRTVFTVLGISLQIICSGHGNLAYSFALWLYVWVYLKCISLVLNI